MEKVRTIQREIAGLLLETKRDANNLTGMGIIESDSSMGFHNPEKAREMLTMSPLERYIFHAKFLTWVGIFFLATLIILLIQKRDE